MISIIPLVLALADKVLALWIQKDKDKYNAKLLKLKTEYYAEKNKAEEERDFARIDELEFEILLFANALLNQVTLNK